VGLITAIIDYFFAKDLCVEMTPEMFIFHLATSQLSLKTVIWIQKSRPKTSSLQDSKVLGWLMP